MGCLGPLRLGALGPGSPSPLSKTAQNVTLLPDYFIYGAAQNGCSSMLRSFEAAQLVRWKPTWPGVHFRLQFSLSRISQRETFASTVKNLPDTKHLYISGLYHTIHFNKADAHNSSRFCLSVCLSDNFRSFESLNVESWYLYIRCVSRQYGSSLYMKVIGSKSRSQEPKTPKMPISAM